VRRWRAARVVDLRAFAGWAWAGAFEEECGGGGGGFFEAEQAAAGDLDGGGDQAAEQFEQ